MGRRGHHIREVNAEENAELRRFASSRTHPFRTVQRAKLIVSPLDDNTFTAFQASKKVGFKSLNSGAGRATFDPDYGHWGKVWVHGAFEPATGKRK